MALKIKVPAQTTIIDANTLYMDITKMDKLTDEIDENLSKLIYNLTSMQNELKRGAKSGAVKGNYYKKLFNTASGNISAEITKLKNRKKGLKTKYESDKKEVKMSVLEGKVDELEKEITKLKTDNSKTAEGNKEQPAGNTEQQPAADNTNSNQPTADNTNSNQPAGNTEQQPASNESK